MSPEEIKKLDPKAVKLAAMPGQAWIHLFVSHLVTAAYAMTVGAGIGGTLGIFDAAVMGWSLALAGGVMLAYIILLWLTVRAALKTGIVSPPFFLVRVNTDE